MRLIIVRHGQTVENKNKTTQGQLPGRLTKEGRAQAKQVGRRLKEVPIDICFTSDLKRAVDTTREIIRQHNGKVKVIQSRPLREWLLGEIQGIPKTDEEWEVIRAKLNRGWVPKGAESEADFSRRVRRFWNKLRKTKSYRGKTILIVSHGGAIKRLIGVILKKTKKEVYLLHQKNASVTIIDVNDGKSVMRRYNCTAHLCYPENRRRMS